MKKSDQIIKEALTLDDIQKGVGSFISSLTGDKEEKEEKEESENKKNWKTAPVTSPYGPRGKLNIDGSKPHFHGGVDIGVKRGTPVYSVYEGTVNSRPHWNPHKGGMGGWDLSIRSRGPDGEFLMQYIHLDKVDVAAGHRVRSGQKIGETGEAGTGPHLHLQKRLLPSMKTVAPTHEEEENSLKMRIIDLKRQKHDTSGAQEPRPVVFKQDSISVPAGTSIHSIKEGIASVHNDSREGIVIIVADPVLFGLGNIFGFGKDDSFVYSGIASTSVKDGDKIKKGQVLGVARKSQSVPGEYYVTITKNVDGRRVHLSSSEIISATNTTRAKKFAPVGIMSTNASRPVDAPIKGRPGERNVDNYNAVIDQFQVDVNPRYTPRKIHPDAKKKATFCNIFVSDVTEAMGSPLPHWVDKDGNPGRPGKGFYELGGNASVAWLEKHGSRFGWKRVDEKQAQDYANQGHPVVAGEKNVAGTNIGHVAIVRPGKIKPGFGPAVANAGGKNINKSHIANTFGIAEYKNNRVGYWANLSE